MKRITEKGVSSILLEIAKSIEPKPIPSGPSVANLTPLTLNTVITEVTRRTDLSSIDPNTEILRMKNRVGNRRSFDYWNLNELKQLKELIIGNHCLQNVEEMVLNQFTCLEKVEIGSHCCTKREKGRFEVSQCGKLRSLKIGSSTCGQWREFMLVKCSVVSLSIGDGCFVSCENVVCEGGNGVSA